MAGFLIYYSYQYIFPFVRFDLQNGSLKLSVYDLPGYIATMISNIKYNIHYKRKYNCIIFPILVILLATCSTVKNIKISVLVPAQVNIPGNVKKLSLISRIYPENITGSLDSLNNLQLNPEENYYSLSSECLYAVSDVLKVSPRFEQIKIAGNYAGIDNIHYPGPSIQKAEVREKCESDSTDALLSLEYFKLNDSIRYSMEIFDIHIIDYTIFTTTAWKIYYPGNFSVTQSFVLKDTLVWLGTGSTDGRAVNDLPSVGNMIIKSFNKAGTDCGKLIAPYWVNEINRFYYTSGNKNFRLAKKFAREEDWNNAAELWNPLTNNPNNNIAAKAAFNMALACELQDRIDLAIMWIEKSDSLLKDPRTQIYRNILKSRLEGNKVLDNQLNSN